MAPARETVRVELADRSYDVVVGRDAIDQLGPRLTDLLTARRCLLVTDEGLPDEAVARATASLSAAGFEPAPVSVRPTEANKVIETVERLLIRATESRLERTDAVVALGGGIVGDIAGFVAASYKRGVPFVQCPTTLLSMVDASVGGKTGVNLRAGGSLHKNLVGAFWQPRLVLADTALLDTLPDRVLRAGLAECLKHAMLSAGVTAPGAGEPVDPGLFRWTTEHLPALRARDADLLTALVARNVRVKAAVVAGDEREEAPSAAGGRALLNLGHTFGHAIETIGHLSPDNDPAHAPLHHGEAVAFGLRAAAHAAHALGVLSPDDLTTIRSGIGALAIGERLAELPDDQDLLARMAHDKKVRRGRIRLVLPTGVGVARVFEDPPIDAVRAGLASIRG